MISYNLKFKFGNFKIKSTVIFIDHVNGKRERLWSSNTCAWISLPVAMFPTVLNAADSTDALGCLKVNLILINKNNNQHTF